MHARFNRVLPVLSSAVLLAAMPAFAQELNPQERRISGPVIHADHETYQATQGRIKALNDKGVRVDNYTLAKAQCWLDTSFHEYTRNDRGGYPQAALAESARLISALENGTDPGIETPLVNGAEKLRPDLWAKFDALRAHAGFRCATQATACAEVELVHAGNEIHDGGWRHANPYIQIAEDLTSRAEAAAAACPSESAPVQERPSSFDLGADALFMFDRGDLAGLLPGGQGRLDALAMDLRERGAAVRNLTVTGHTDRLGSDEYNQALSERRAATVRDYLLSKGVQVSVAAQGAGESQPVTTNCVGERATAELKACLQPDRRVRIDIAQ